MIKYIVVHRNDKNNVGDLSSNPLQYFLSSSEYQVVDITDINNVRYDPGIPIIVGGGGLIGNDTFGDSIRKVLSSSDKNQLTELWNMRWHSNDPANRQVNQQFLSEFQTLISSYSDQLSTNTSPKILWGAGHNGELTKRPRNVMTYPDWLSEFDIAGVRDWNQSLPWAPCASCMHPALRKYYPIKNDIIWFEHKKQLLKDFGKESIPRYINSGSNIEHTIELLGSANIIITNSYHGAYWGTLLKKRVIVVSPWSSKFFALRHQVPIVDKSDQWTDAIDRCEIYQSALDDCITETLNMWTKVQSL